MLYGEYKLEDEIAVVREEVREEEREKAYQDKLMIARNLLSEGSTPDFVHKITGLSLEEIAKL